MRDILGFLAGLHLTKKNKKKHCYYSDLYLRTPCFYVNPASSLANGAADDILEIFIILPK